MRVKVLVSCILAVVVIAAALIGISSCGRKGKLIAINVLPQDASIIPGSAQQFQAEGVLSDGGTYILYEANWSLSSTSVATIGSTGILVASTTTGTTMITAADPYSSFSGTTMLTIDLPASIKVTPTNPSITPGLTHQFTATGNIRNAATQNLTEFVTWTSLNPAVATVVSTPGIDIIGSGVVTSIATGTAIIQATDPISGIVGTTTLIVTALPLAGTILNPANPVIAADGAALQFTLEGIYSDGTTRDWTASAIWSSSVTAVATIDINGLATPVAAGTTVIAARDPITGIVASTTLTVTLDNGTVITP
ncbi:MAG TPA: Ig-like domain-containing protein [Nitrospirota bacterium]|nr:Ig-like domain-containing protein [Nitrospirota bacterium]